MLDKLLKIMIGIILILVFLSQPLSVPSVLSMIIGGGLGYMAYKISMKEKYFMVLLIAFLLVTRGMSIVCVQTPLESDFATMYMISQEILTGNLSTVSQEYMNTYSYQIPYILYQAGLLIIQPEVLFLKCLNVLYSVVTVLLLYSIAKKMASTGAVPVVTIAYAILFFPTTYVSVISNQWIATIFLLGALRIVVGSWKSKFAWKSVLVGLLLALAQLLRPDAIVTVLAIIAYGIYRLIQDKALWKRYVQQILVFICTYSIVTNGVMSLVQTQLVTEKMPDDYLWKLVCGLNASSGGRWNLEDYYMVHDDTLTLEEKTQLEWQLIQERLTQNDLLALWKAKMYTYWNEKDYGWAFGYTDTITIGNQNINQESLVAMARKVDKVIWGSVVVLAFIGIVAKRKKAMLLYIVLIGTWMMYLFIEVQARYSYFTDILIYIQAGIGIDVLVKWIHKQKKERKYAKN